MCICVRGCWECSFHIPFKMGKGRSILQSRQCGHFDLFMLTCASSPIWWRLLLFVLPFPKQAGRPRGVKAHAWSSFIARGTASFQWSSHLAKLDSRPVKPNTRRHLFIEALEGMPGRGGPRLPSVILSKSVASYLCHVCWQLCAPNLMTSSLLTGPQNPAATQRLPSGVPVGGVAVDLLRATRLGLQNSSNGGGGRWQLSCSSFLKKIKNR